MHFQTTTPEVPAERLARLLARKAVLQQRIDRLHTATVAKVRKRLSGCPLSADEQAARDAAQAATERYVAAVQEVTAATAIDDPFQVVGALGEANRLLDKARVAWQETREVAEVAARMRQNLEFLELSREVRDIDHPFNLREACEIGRALAAARAQGLV